MNKLPDSLVLQMKIVMVQFDLIDLKEAADPNLDQRIQNYALLLLRVMQDVQKISREVPYRVVEFGCGTFHNLLIWVSAIGLIYGRSIQYIGIDIDKEAIEQSTLTLPAFLKGTCRYIHADGSDVKWMQTAGISKFHAALFHMPIVTPFKEQLDYIRTKYNEVQVERWKKEHGERIIKSSVAFMTIFKEVLPISLESPSSVLIYTSYDDEYHSVLKKLTTVSEDSPENQKNANQRLLVWTFKPKIALE